MRNFSGWKGQHGAVTIFVSIMMLLFITVMVIAAFSLSTINLKSVGNAQVRLEALSAANSAIEEVLASPFTDDPNEAVLIDYEVAMDGDKRALYQVNMPIPSCVRATPASSTTSSSVTLPGMSAVGAWQTVWELDATATQVNSGVSTRVLHGVRVLLDNVEKQLVCP